MPAVDPITEGERVGVLNPEHPADRNDVVRQRRLRGSRTTRKGRCGVLTTSSPNPLGYAESEGDGHTHLSLRFLLAVDVEGFSRRSTLEQMKVQHDLEYAMATAAAKADLDRRSWYRQPGGDGELAVLPQDGNGLSLVADFPRCLAGVLAEINRSELPGSRLRKRMAIHHGAVTPACRSAP